MLAHEVAERLLRRGAESDHAFLRKRLELLEGERVDDPATARSLVRGRRDRERRADGCQRAFLVGG
jgi:hypothetical protein